MASLIVLATPLIANAGGWKTTISNDFSKASDIIDWNFNANALPTDYLLENGYLELQMLQTDKGGRVISPKFQIVDNLMVTVKHYLHQGRSAYIGGIALIKDDKYIGIDFQNSGGTGYYQECSDYNIPRVKAVYNNAAGNCVPKSFQSATTSSSLYNHWITTVIQYSPTTGKLTIDYENDKKVDFIGTVKKSDRFVPTNIMFTGYGWYTGHFQRIDSVKIESTE